MNGSKTARRLSKGVLAVIILVICLLFTTMALVYSTLSVNNNLFHTGFAKINLNDGKPVISEHEFIFEPGMTVRKNFFIQNESGCDVYYKIYFDNVDGKLSDVLKIRIKDGGKVLYEAKADEFMKKDVAAADDILKIGEKKELAIEFYYPNESGNDTQENELTFNLCAEGVQTKNNPNKLFN